MMFQGQTAADAKMCIISQDPAALAEQLQPTNYHAAERKAKVTQSHAAC